MKKNIANYLTITRIISGLSLLFVPVFSNWFYVFYIFGGFTDAIDGTVARKLGIVTPLGSRLDTIADFIYLLATILKLTTSLFIPIWLYIWFFIIAIIKLTNIIIGYIKHHRFIVVHSYINKTCGIVIFILPLIIGRDFHWQTKALATIFAFTLSSIAAIHETIVVYNGKSIE